MISGDIIWWMLELSDGNACWLVGRVQDRFSLDERKSSSFSAGGDGNDAPEEESPSGLED